MISQTVSEQMVRPFQDLSPIYCKHIKGYILDQFIGGFRLALHSQKRISPTNKNPKQTKPQSNQRGPTNLTRKGTYSLKPVTVRSDKGISQDTVMVVSVDVTKLTVGAVGTALAGMVASGEYMVSPTVTRLKAETR